MWRWLSRLRVRLHFDLIAPIDWLSPCELEADDRFIAPLSAEAVEAARLREIASLRTLAARATRSHLKLVPR